MKLHWQKSYAINIPTIDAQHRQLFHTYAELMEAIGQGVKSAVIRNTLDRLQQYVTRHFILEEKHMQESGYPGLTEQVQAHEEFRTIFSKVLNDFNSQGLTPAIVNTIKNELGEWLQHHVLELDMEFGRFLHSGRP